MHINTHTTTPTQIELYKTWWPNYTYPVQLGLVEVRRCKQLSRVSQVCSANVRALDDIPQYSV